MKTSLILFILILAGCATTYEANTPFPMSFRFTNFSYTSSECKMIGGIPGKKYCTEPAGVHVIGKIVSNR